MDRFIYVNQKTPDNLFTGSDVQKHVYYSTLKSENYYSDPTAICGAMTDHFNGLVLANGLTKNSLIKSAEKLEDGATEKAMVAQIKGYSGGIFEGYSVKHTVLNVGNKVELKKDQKLIATINGLDNGVYRVRDLPVKDRKYLEAHASSFIKLSSNLGYIFDPNVGLIKLQGNIGKKYLERLTFNRSLTQQNKGSDRTLFFLTKVEGPNKPSSKSEGHSTLINQHLSIMNQMRSKKYKNAVIGPKSAEIL